MSSERKPIRTYYHMDKKPVILPPKTFAFKTMDISGDINSSYELGCQRMLYLGIQWLKGKKLRVFDGMHGYSRIVGVQNTEKSQLGELEETWYDDPFLKEGGITGAMHQFVLSHLKVIHEEGVNNWIKMVSEVRKGEAPIEVVWRAEDEQISLRGRHRFWTDTYGHEQQG